MSITRKSFRGAFLLFFAAIITIAVFFCTGEPAEAKSAGYETIHGNTAFSCYYADNMQAVKKVGSRYIKCVYPGWAGGTYDCTYYYSKKKNSGFKKLLSYDIRCNDIATNGTRVVFLKRHYAAGTLDYTEVVSKTIGKSKLKKHYTFRSGDAIARVAGASGSHVYFHVEDLASGKYTYYDLNMSTGKMKKLKMSARVNILAQQGGTAVCYDGNLKLGLYKVSSGRLKKVRTLEDSYDTDIGIVDGKIYYVTYNSSYSKAILKCCSLNGKNKKILGKFKVPSDTDQMRFHKVTSKYCIIEGTTTIYKYTYKGKKLKKISKKALKKEIRRMADSI